MSPELLLLLVLAAVGKTGSSTRPVLTFKPNYTPIFKGDKIKMVCASKPKEKTYSWFHSDVSVFNGTEYDILNADSRHSGNYQCQIPGGMKSERVRLDVIEGTLILQTNPYVHEGDRLSLKCQHNPRFSAERSIFYKDGTMIRDWDKSNLLTTSSIRMTATGTYKCTKEISQNSRTVLHSATVSVSVKELFSTPEIRATKTPNGGTKVILTCHTNGSTYTLPEESTYGFYKDGEIVKPFSSANQYEVPPGNSGKYYCSVRPQTSSVMKSSKQINVTSSINHAVRTQTTVGLALSECLLIISFMFIFIT